MSRFVSAGTDDSPTERDEAWLKAQAQIDATKQKKVEVGQQDGGRSLYEVLQANKAAKQEAFEEQTRLRNQFRTLDEDEVEFLDSVLETTRTKEAEVKRETKEQLELFRSKREEAERAAKQADTAEDVVVPEKWTVGPRKRKKGQEQEGIVGGIKIRRVSTADDSQALATDPSPRSSIASAEATKRVTQTEPKAETATGVTDARATGTSPDKSKKSSTSDLPPKLGLGAYSSDEEE